MPGFNVGGLGVGPAAAVQPFCSYTWQIQNLFGTQILDTTPLIYLKECTLPTFSAKKEEVLGGSLAYKYADGVTWEDVRVTFYDVPLNGQTLAGYLRNWRTKVWSAAAGIGAPDDYKADSKIDVYNSDSTITKTWTLFGSWPQIIRDGELTYTNSDIKIVEVVICYDWADDGIATTTTPTPDPSSAPTPPTPTPPSSSSGPSISSLIAGSASVAEALAEANR